MSFHFIWFGIFSFDFNWIYLSHFLWFHLNSFCFAVILVFMFIHLYNFISFSLIFMFISLISCHSHFASFHSFELISSGCASGGFELFGSSSHCGSLLPGRGGNFRMERQSNNWQKIYENLGASIVVRVWVRVRGREVEQREGGSQFEFGSRSVDVSSSSGSPAPLAPLELGFSSGSTNLKNKIWM